jgi:hypothetical protein
MTHPLLRFYVFFLGGKGYTKGAFTLGVSDSSVESHNTMLAI